MTKFIKAKVEGTNYTLKGLGMIGDKPVEVTEEQAEYLLGSEHFKFTEVDSSEVEEIIAEEVVVADEAPKEEENQTTKPVSKWTVAECVEFMEANELTTELDDPKVADLRSIIKDFKEAEAEKTK